MEAPKGVEINAEAGNMEATCRSELRLESKDGEVRSGKDRNWSSVAWGANLSPRLVCTEINLTQYQPNESKRQLNRMIISQTIHKIYDALLVIYQDNAEYVSQVQNHTDCENKHCFQILSLSIYLFLIGLK